MLFRSKHAIRYSLVKNYLTGSIHRNAPIQSPTSVTQSFIPQKFLSLPNNFEGKIKNFDTIDQVDATPCYISHPYLPAVDIDSKKFHKNFIDLPDNIEEMIDIQIKHEIDGYALIPNIVPPNFEMISQSNNGANQLLKEWKHNMIERIDYRPFKFKKKEEFSQIFKILTREEIFEVVLEETLTELLTCNVGVPLNKIIISFGEKVFEKYLIKKHQILNHYDTIKKVHIDFLNHIKHHNVESYTDLWRKILHGHITPDNTWKHERAETILLAALGAYLTELLIQSSPLFDGKKILYHVLDKSPKYKKALVSCLCSNPDAVTTFQKVLYQRDFMKIPTKIMPMLVPAVPIHRYYCGGYVTEFNYQLLRYPYYLARLLNQQKCEKLELEHLLNILSSSGLVGWKVDPTLLDIMTNLFKNNVSDEKLRMYPFASVTDWVRQLTDHKDADENVFKTLKYSKMLEIRKKTNETYSLWVELHKNIVILNYLKGKKFYLPYNLDYRGRFYPMCTTGHHYSGENFRSLLRFSKELPLDENGASWLFLQFDNMYGGTKGKNRSQTRFLLNSKIPDIISTGYHKNIVDNKFLRSSSRPWQVLSLCIEIYNGLTAPDQSKLTCSIPIHQDGASNGLQHYSALGKNLVEASFVHVHPSKFYYDLYSDISYAVSNECYQDSTKVDVADAVMRFSSRKGVKTPVMTFVYGVTLYGAHQQVKSYIAEKIFPERRIQGVSIDKMGRYLSRCILKYIYVSFTGTRSIMDWLKAISVFQTSHGMTTTWTSPLNLVVSQSYFKDEHVSFVSRLGQHRILKEPNDKSKLDFVKQKNSFPPNFIHSLDASHMAFTQESCLKKGITFTAIHDSFWTHPVYSGHLYNILRDEFYELHKEDQLLILKKQTEKIIGAKFGVDPPEKKGLDISTVKQSKYFFS